MLGRSFAPLEKLPEVIKLNDVLLGENNPHQVRGKYSGKYWRKQVSQIWVEYIGLKTVVGS